MLKTYGGSRSMRANCDWGFEDMRVFRKRPEPSERREIGGVLQS
jgi:hypothetical protein